MPITLDNIQGSAQNIKTYEPKFFDTVLTGKGQKIGLINENRNPVHIKDTQATPVEILDVRKKKIVNGDTTALFMPFSMLTYSVAAKMMHYPVPPLTEMTEIGNCTTAQSVRKTLYFYMPPHASVLTEKNAVDQGGTKSSTKTLLTCYHAMIFAVSDEKKPADVYNAATLPFACDTVLHDTNQCLQIFTCNPMIELEKACKTINGQSQTNVDFKKVSDFIMQYDLYSAICKKSQEWQTSSKKVMTAVFTEMSSQIYNPVTQKKTKVMLLNDMASQLRYIESYNIPLDDYREIYKELANHFQPDDAKILCKQNLNLLLSDTLHNLDKNKSQLTQLPTPANPVNIDPMYSIEQVNAIKATEPLVLIQSGAGCGKSSVILGRINYMKNCGVKPSDITVLSFTNAAADHIADICPGVNSMTIASMIHNIYSTNFKNHELSSIDTMVNSLDIYYKGDKIASEFKRRLINIMKNDSDAFTMMNNFVEYNYDDIIKILDTIGQTCLEMEIIICYQKIDTFNEPPEVQSKYLIIDEVQDNSIFEFIYVLRYTDKHKEALFMVGDCSQTLYEFRASNPKALNALEGSGVFQAYQLQVNYRSNQEILDFANVLLNNIEANQYAKIQLQANSLAKVTEKSFTDAVEFHYEFLSKISEANQALPTMIQQAVKPYIDKKLAAGEKVTFMAYTRRHVESIKRTLEEMYPGKNIVNLTSEKMYNSTIFSEFIKRYWEEIKFVPSQSILPVIAQAIYDRLDHLVYNKDKAMPSVQKLIAGFMSETGSIVTGWSNQVANGQMTVDAFMDNVKISMLSYEIRHNAVKQSLVSARNEENKKTNAVDNASFILSTIHGAKGLEFDNVVVLYKNENNLEEDKKRMYYVALTRAMKSEFVLAYGNVKSPKIQADYDYIVEKLHAKYPDPNSKLSSTASSPAPVPAQA